MSLLYADRVPKGLMNKIRKSLDKIELESILSTGYIRPFVESDNFELFSSTGTTERPDVLCSKLIEGRVALLGRRSSVCDRYSQTILRKLSDS